MSLHLATSLSSLPTSVFSSKRPSLLIGTDSRVSVFSCTDTSSDCDSCAPTTLPKVTEQSGELSSDSSFRPKDISSRKQYSDLPSPVSKEGSVYLLEEKLAQKDEVLLEMTKLQADLCTQLREHQEELEDVLKSSAQQTKKYSEELEGLREENQRLNRAKSESETTIKRLSAEKQYLLNEISVKNQTITRLEEEIAVRSQSTGYYESRLQESAQKLSRYRCKEVEFKGKLREMASVVEENRVLGEKMEELKRLFEARTKTDSEIQCVSAELKTKDMMVEGLRSQIDTLKKDLATRPSNSEVSLYLKRIEELEKHSTRHRCKSHPDRTPLSDSYFKLYQQVSNLMVACCPPETLTHSPSPKTVWKWVRNIAEELMRVRGKKTTTMGATARY